MSAIFRVLCSALLAALLAAGPLPTRASSAPSTSAPSSSLQLEDYVLGSSDKIRVIVFGEESLSGEFRVSGNGKVALPLVGEVQAAGLTLATFQNTVRTALKDGYLKDPKVSVEVLTFRPFYILGEVGKPGEYAFASGMNVLNAVATAGGFTYRANTKKVFIKRATDTSERVYPLTSTTPVWPGDTIRIAERFF